MIKAIFITKDSAITEMFQAFDQVDARAKTIYNLKYVRCFQISGKKKERIEKRGQR